MPTNYNPYYIRLAKKNRLHVQMHLFISCVTTGLIIQGGYGRWVYIRISGVLQRLALCYFFAALLVLIFDDSEDEPYSSQWPIGEFNFLKTLKMCNCILLKVTMFNSKYESNYRIVYFIFGHNGF